MHEHQPELLSRGVEAVVGADDSAKGRLDVLERLAAEFARFGGAYQVRGDPEQHGLPLSVAMPRILGAPAFADIEGRALVFA